MSSTAVELRKQAEAAEYVQRRLIDVMHEKMSLNLKQNEAEFCRQVLAAHATHNIKNGSGDIYDRALAQECLRLAERMRAHSLKPAGAKGKNMGLNLSEASSLSYVLVNTTFAPEQYYEQMLSNRIIAQLDKK